MSLDKTLIGALNLLLEHRDSIEQCHAMPDGRVHDAEARADVERHEAACAAIRDAISVLQMERSQHDADTRELCSLRTERDAARRQRDNWKFAHDGWQPAAEYVRGLSSAGVLPAGMLGMHCGDALVAFVEQLRRERDELAARLAEIEAQPPVAWQSRFTDGGGWAGCSERHARMVAAAPDEWPGYEVRTLFARPAPAAAPELAEPVLEVRACGCSQAKAGRCVMGDYGALPIGTKLYAGDAPTCSSNGLLGASSGVGRECGMWIDGVCTSPEPCQHQQRPCRCGPDGCSDSVACPRKGGAA